MTYLCSLPSVDTTKIFTFGFSMGAYRSWQLAAEDSRVAGCAASNWMTTIRYTGGFITGVSSWSMYRPVPEGKREKDVDYPLIAARISPRPFLLLYGERDHVLPAKGTRQAVRVIRRKYHNRQFRPMAFPADHEFTPEHYAALLDWLQSTYPLPLRGTPPNLEGELKTPLFVLLEEKIVVRIALDMQFLDAFVHQFAQRIDVGFLARGDEDAVGSRAVGL